MGLKLLWTAVAIYLITPVLAIPAGEIVAGVLAVIGVILFHLDK